MDRRTARQTTRPHHARGLRPSAKRSSYRRRPVECAGTDGEWARGSTCSPAATRAWGGWGGLRRHIKKKNLLQPRFDPAPRSRDEGAWCRPGGPDGRVSRELVVLPGGATADAVAHPALGRRSVLIPPASYSCQPWIEGGLLTAGRGRGPAASGYPRSPRDMPRASTSTDPDGSRASRDSSLDDVVTTQNSHHIRATGRSRGRGGQSGADVAGVGLARTHG